MSFYRHLQLRSDLLRHFVDAYSYRTIHFVILSTCRLYLSCFCHFIGAFVILLSLTVTGATHLIVLSACKLVFISSWSFYSTCNYVFGFFVILLSLTVTRRLTLSFYRHAGFIYPVFAILLAYFVILSNLLSFYRFYPFCHFIDRCHYSDKHHFVILSLRSFCRCLRCVLPLPELSAAPCTSRSAAPVLWDDGGLRVR